MKKLVFVVLTVVFLIASFCLAGCGGPGKKPTKVDDNLAATKLEADMVYGQDFAMDNDYMMTFVQTAMCSELVVNGDVAHFKIQNNTAYTPYFIWVCYSQITKSSRATLICLKEVGGSLKESGDYVVLGVVREDTNRCLLTFGGTYGTRQNGW